MVRFRSRRKGRRRIVYPLREIRVRRRGYVRDGTRVAPTAYRIRDLGAPGRGRKVLPDIEAGKLGLKFTDGMSDERMKEILAEEVRRDGEREVAGRLRWLQVMNKRTNPKLSKKCAELADWVFGSFIGRRRVRTGTGYS